MYTHSHTHACARAFTHTHRRTRTLKPWETLLLSSSLNFFLKIGNPLGLEMIFLLFLHLHPLFFQLFFPFFLFFWFFSFFFFLTCIFGFLPLFFPSFHGKGWFQSRVFTIFFPTFPLSSLFLFFSQASIHLSICLSIHPSVLPSIRPSEIHAWTEISEYAVFGSFFLYCPFDYQSKILIMLTLTRGIFPLV